ncbi:MAG: hypothetical protein KDC53_04630 [Saprospiraceae bacterium]|nr:hypothetical protein [Saprospiraceae bacterium]
MKRFLKKPTLLFALGILTILIALYSIFFTSWESGKGIYIAFVHIPAILLSMIAIVIDRMIALRTKISPIKLSIYELIIITIVGIFFLYSQREVIVEPANGKNIEFYLVLQNPGNLESDKTIRKFPFDKKIFAKHNVLIVDYFWNTVVRPGWDDPQYLINTFHYEKYPQVKLVSKLTSDISEKMNEDLIDTLLLDKVSKNSTIEQ